MKSAIAKYIVFLALATGGTILAVGTACSSSISPWQKSATAPHDGASDSARAAASAVTTLSPRDVMGPAEVPESPSRHVLLVKHDLSLNKHISAKTLGSLFARTLREIPGLSYEVLITQADLPQPIRCKVTTARNARHHLQVYEGIHDDGRRPFYELQASPSPHGVRIKESNHRGNEEDEYEVCLADYCTNGTWDMRCKKDTNACSFGAHLAPWVGPKARQTAFWEKVISEGEYVGREDVDGHVCDVVATHRVQGLVEKFYLDRKTHLIRRWFHNYRGIARDRVFTNIKLVTELAGAPRDE